MSLIEKSSNLKGISMQQERPKCYVMVGLPGSGKSTYAAQVSLTVLSTDFIVERLSAAQGKTYAEGFQNNIKKATSIFNREVDECVKAGRSFVWDQTNLTRKKRIGIVDRLSRTHDVECIHVVATPATLEANRAARDKQISESVLRKMENSYEQPSHSEGFLRITTVHSELLPDGVYQLAVSESERSSLDSLVS